MARPRTTGEKTGTGKRRIEQYDHKGQQRKNNPPVGLVTEATDRDTGRKQYAYDPHLDPTLTWAGKAEHTWIGHDSLRRRAMGAAVDHLRHLAGRHDAGQAAAHDGGV